MKPSRLTAVAVVALWCGSIAATAQNEARLLQEAQAPSALEGNLRVLTDEVGGRVPGTPAMEKAMQWAERALKAAGGQNVHREAFSIAQSWQEGNTSVRALPTESTGFNVPAVSHGWAAPLLAHHHVRVVDVGNGSPEEFAKAGRLAGAMVLVHSDEMKSWADLFAEYDRGPGIAERAAKAHALVVAFMSTRPYALLYRHTDTQTGRVAEMPQLLLAREGALRMARLVAAGKQVFVDVSVPNHVGGPVATANVVAELRGSEKPDEWVVLGAHLDSWELGTGALDNGCNAALVIDALRAIHDSGLKPKRSIRFLLFSGEEEGLLGSRAYVKAHKAELDKAAGVVIFDSGIGRVTGFSLGGRKDVVAKASDLVQPLQTWDAAKLTTDGDMGTDNFDFLLEGVPTFVANQEEGNYLINYHATSDTLDKVDFAVLKRHVAEAVVFTYRLADSAERVGKRLRRAEIEQTLHETHLDDSLKAAGLWDAWQKGELGRKD